MKTGPEEPALKSSGIYFNDFKEKISFLCLNFNRYCWECPSFVLANGETFSPIPGLRRMCVHNCWFSFLFRGGLLPPPSAKGTNLFLISFSRVMLGFGGWVGVLLLNEQASERASEWVSKTVLMARIGVRVGRRLGWRKSTSGMRQIIENQYLSQSPLQIYIFSNFSSNSINLSYFLRLFFVSFPQHWALAPPTKTSSKLPFLLFTVRDSNPWRWNFSFHNATERPRRGEGDGKFFRNYALMKFFLSTLSLLFGCLSFCFDARNVERNLIITSRVGYFWSSALRMPERIWGKRDVCC